MTENLLANMIITVFAAECGCMEHQVPHAVHNFSYVFYFYVFFGSSTSEDNILFVIFLIFAQETCSFSLSE